jgi:site-specific DNA recombinase
MDTYFRARELASTRARLAWGMEKRIASGKMWPNWRAPFGMRWADEDKSALAVDEKTIGVVLRIFNDIPAKVGAKQLARRLTDEGILSPTGRDHWSADTICDIIRNPVYRGIAVVRRRGVPSRVVFDESKGIFVRRRNRDTDYDLFTLPEGTVPRVVSDDLWQAAERALASGFLGQRRGNLDGKYLLRGGFAVCAECGHALRPAYGKNHQLIYACRSNGGMLCRTGASVRVTQEYLDVSVWSGIIDICAQPKLVEQRLAELSGTVRLSV